MNGTIEFLTNYGYTAVFTCVLAEQLGLPLPATPVLIAAGALAGLGKLNLGMVLLLAVAASLIGDSLWYYLGKVRGMSVLRLLCKISLEPDSCVRRTNSTYSKHGSRWLLFAKFIPGVSTIAPPMAGIYRVNPWKFIAMDGGGAGLWAGAFLSAGWCFRNQTDAIAAYADRLGEGLGLGLECGGAIPFWAGGVRLELQIQHPAQAERRSDDGRVARPACGIERHNPDQRFLPYALAGSRQRPRQ